MSEPQNVEVIRKAYDAFGKGDFQELVSLLSEDVSWLTPGPPDMPTAGYRRGHQAVHEYFMTLATVGDIVRFEPKDFLTHGDKVVVLGDDIVRMKASGKDVDFHWVHIFIVKDGKVSCFEERADVSALVAELRAAPA